MAAICGAKTRAGTPCQKARAKGRTRCKLHGGATPRGRASPQWKHGRAQRPHNRIGRLLQGGRREAFLAHRGNNAADLQDSLALCSVRAEELVAKLETTDPAAWGQARTLVTQLDAASAAGNTRQMGAVLMELRALVMQGATNEGTWNDLLGVFRESAHLARAQSRVEADRQLTVHRDRLLDLMEQMADLFGSIIRKHVPAGRRQRDALTEVAEGLHLLAGTDQPDDAPVH